MSDTRPTSAHASVAGIAAARIAAARVATARVAAARIAAARIAAARITAARITVSRAVAVLFAAVALMVAAVTSVHAQELRVRPAVLIEDDPLLGIRATAEVQRDQVRIGAYPRNWYWAAAADAPLFTSADRNPETLRARFDGGLQISLFRPSTPVGRAPSPDDPEPWNYGYVALLLAVGAEAPQKMNTGDFTVGGAVAYEHDQYHRLWFLPEVRVAYDAVFCVDCDGSGTAGEAADAGDGNDSGWRVDGQVAWSIPADRGWVPGPLRPLWLRLQGRGFRSSGLEDAGALRNDDGMWGSAELAYRCDACGPVHEVYVRGHGGRVPQPLREKRAVTAGVSLFF